jgi:hypothetical protein
MTRVRTGIFTLALLATPAVASAQEGLSYAVSGVLPTICEVDGTVFTVAGGAGAGQAVVEGAVLTTTIDLTSSGDQEIAQVIARCNGSGASVTISSVNAFRLLNGSGGPNRELPFVVRVGGTSLAGGVSSQASYTEPLPGGGASPARPLSISVGAVDLGQLVAGPYSDTLVISVAPSS